MSKKLSESLNALLKERNLTLQYLKFWSRMEKLFGHAMPQSEVFQMWRNMQKASKKNKKNLK